MCPSSQHRYTCAAMFLYHKLASHNETCCVGTAHQASPCFVSPHRQWLFSGLQETQLAAVCIAHDCPCSRVGRDHVVPCILHCCWAFPPSSCSASVHTLGALLLEFKPCGSQVLSILYQKPTCRALTDCDQRTCWWFACMHKNAYMPHICCASQS